jgi:glycosyltransferase involved in cell wall biosynthesis
MVPFATSAQLVEDVLELEENQHHAWGVKELLQAGIEVTVIERQSAWIERFGQDWNLPSGDDYDLIYSNHNRLIRSPLEKLLGLRKTPLVSLVYAGEPLFLAGQHCGVLCMTPHAARRVAERRTRAMYAPWGIDPDSKLHFQIHPTGDHFVSTGVTERDFDTLFRAAKLSGERVVLAARGQTFSGAPRNIETVQSKIGPWEIRELYKGAAGGLVILSKDDKKRTAVGWTNVLEMMALGIPIIKTRTGSLDEIVDLESIGAGFLVEPGDTGAIVAAMRRLRNEPETRRSMGTMGAAYVREHLNMERFARPLIEMVNSLSR